MSAPTAAAAAPAEGDLKQCQRCDKVLETSAFTLKKNGEPQKRCEPCRIKGNANNNTSPNYAASVARHRATDLHKATNKRWRNGPVGKASVARGNAAKVQRCADDPSFRERLNVHALARSICSGTIKSSPKFLAKTGWTAEEFRAHIQAQFTPGMTWANYGKGKFWDLDHRIPQSAFRFPDETRKCWHAANVRPLSTEENMGKKDKLLDEEILRVPVAAWPAWFGGRIPTEAEKKAFRAAQRH